MSKKNEEVEERKQFIRDWVKKNPLAVSGSELIDALCARYPEITPGGHRGMVGRVLDGDRPWNRAKTCPVEGCDTVGHDMKEALSLFGWRYKKTQLQSHCKKCRNAARRAKRAERRAAAKAAADAGQVDLEDALAEKAAS